MTLLELKTYIKKQEIPDHLIGSEKKEYEKALETAWSAYDNACFGQWADAMKFACIALKIERDYDLEAPKWKQLPKVIINIMYKSLWDSDSST
jgi:hypothetical protein